MSNLLSEYTTLNIGGPCEEIIPIKDELSLISTLKKLHGLQKNYLVIGSGSNLLISDEGFDGTVVINQISGITQDGNNLTVKSGTVLQDVVDFANEKGLSGLECLAGIPGTVGGGVYGNAGAYGQTISDHMLKVLAYDVVNDQKIELSPQDSGFSYRDSNFKRNHFIILEVTFGLESSLTEKLQEISSEIILKRLAKYPADVKCPGSFFKNIIADSLSDDILNNIPKEKIMFGKIPAGALLEEVGAKGDCLGQIEIAPYHANLFINKNDGNAKDFYELAQKYFQKVYNKFKIKLEPEVQLINLPPLKLE